MARRQPPNYVNSVLAKASQEHGIPYSVFKSFAGIESGYNPRAKTGSYKGLFQLSTQEFRKNGGQGNIYDPEANTNAFAKILKTNAALFEKKTGRSPTGSELYLMHQQGTQGATMHLANPDKPAWQNMAATGEGRQKGAGWAKRAIWGNIPSQQKKQFGNVNNVTSGDFTRMWQARYARESGADPATDVAFDPSAAKTPPAPEKGFRVAEANMETPGKGARPGDIQYPDQNVVMVGGGEKPPPTPEHKPIKFDYRAPEYASANDIGAGGPPLPSRNPQDAPEPPASAVLPGSAEAGRSARLSQPVTGGSDSGGSSPDNWQGRAFGGSFGELYARQDQGSSLLKNVLPTPGGPGGFGGVGSVPPPVPTFRQFFQGLFGGFG